VPNARDLRLQADYDHLVEVAEQSGGALRIESVSGKPPDTYVLVYRCRGIEAVVNDRPVYRNLHRVRIRLPARYPAPSAPPVVEMLTPIFHPHVYPNQTVCMGSWVTTEYLEEFALRLGALFQFERQFLNPMDPANPQAMAWTSRNLLLLPTDTCPFMAEARSNVPEPAARPASLTWQEIDPS
jgi:ubiquitin-protein ligase